MKNTTTSIILFLIMLAFVFYSHTVLINICNDINEKCLQIETCLNQKDWEKAYNLAISVKQNVEKHSTVISVYTNHTDINNLSNEVLKLTQYTKVHDNAESLASVHLVKYTSDAIKELQDVSIKNIF